MTTAVNTSNREIITTRLLNAPRELVWKVWTQPEHIKNWFGPDGFTITNHEMAVKPGGVWRFMMHGPNGMEFPNKVAFTKVIQPELLEYVHSSEDENDPTLFHTKVTFEDEDGKTRLTMKAIFETAEARDRVVQEFGAIEGGIQTVNKLEQYLKNMAMPPITIERIYNASAEKVWKALTDKNEMKKWYFDIADFKPEPGFEFSFTGETPDGTKYNHLCQVTDAELNRKLRHSWKYEGFEGISYVTWELIPDGEKTRVKLTHEGLETFPDSPHFARKNFEMGWTEITGTSLKNYLEDK